MTALAEQVPFDSVQDQVDGCLVVFELELYKELPGVDMHKEEDKLSSCVILASHANMQKLTSMFNQCKPEQSNLGVWIRKK